MEFHLKIYIYILSSPNIWLFLHSNMLKSTICILNKNKHFHFLLSNSSLIIKVRIKVFNTKIILYKLL